MKYNRKEIMKKAWEIKKQNTNNVFGLCLKMAWAIAKEGTKVDAKELPELEGSEKQVAWAKDIREKMIAKLDVNNLLTERGVLDFANATWAEELMGWTYLIVCMTRLEKTDWAKMLREKHDSIFDPFEAKYPKSPRRKDDGYEAYRAEKSEIHRQYAEYVHDLGLQFVSSMTKATDFIDRRKCV